MVRSASWLLLLISVSTSISAQQIYWKKDHIYNGPGGKEIAIVTPAPSDATAPTIPSSLAQASSCGSPGNVTATSVQLSWTGSTDNVAVAGYKVYRRKGSGASLPVGSTTGTCFIDQPLQPVTAYTYTVVAFDAAQNHSAASNSIGITTASAAGETIAPGTPQNLRGRALTTSSVRLDWYASTDLGGSGLAGYKIYRDGNLISGGTPLAVLSFEDTGLTGPTTYAYTVTALDNAGNVSAPTPALSITPDPNADNFTRADSSTLGGSWVERESGDVFRIVSNQLQMRGTDASNVTRGTAYWNASISNDQFSQIAFKSSNGSNTETGPAVRIDPNGSAASTSMYMVKYFTGSGVAALIKTVNQGAGAGTVLGSLWYGSLANGDVLRIEAAGSQITVKRNGQTIIGPVNDSTITLGKPGVAILSDPGVPRDSAWDNWAAGPIQP